jgi:hypothetical protein
LIDSEFDQFKNEFRNESNIEIYGTFISKIVNILVDWTIYESFNINEKTKLCKSATNLLALINYMFKTIKLKYLIRLGLKETHIQFLILNYADSLSISLIIESISANLTNPSNLFSLEMTNPTNVMDDTEIYFKIIANNVYETLVKSCDLIFGKNKKTKRSKYLIIKIHENLSNFFKEVLLKQAEANKNVNLTKLKKLTLLMIKINLKNLKRSLNRINIMKNGSIRNSAYYLRIILVIYHLLNTKFYFHCNLI